MEINSDDWLTQDLRWVESVLTIACLTSNLHNVFRYQRSGIISTSSSIFKKEKEEGQVINKYPLPSLIEIHDRGISNTPDPPHYLGLVIGVWGRILPLRQYFTLCLALFSLFHNQSLGLKKRFNTPVTHDLQKNFDIVCAVSIYHKTYLKAPAAFRTYCYNHLLITTFVYNKPQYIDFLRWDYAKHSLSLL